MRDEITAARIANAIRMIKDKFAFIVEGELDLTIYPLLFNEDKLQVHSSFGHERLIAAIDILNEKGEIKVLGIIDRDFRDLTHKIIEIDNVFLTDYHDLETMIIASPVLDVFKKVHIKNKGKDTEIFNGFLLEEFIFDIAYIIASLRYLNYIKEDRFGLRFNNLNYKKIIKYSEKEIVDYILDYSRRNNDEFKISYKDEILQEYEEIKIEKYDKLQFVNGHDLMNLLLNSINLISKKDIKFNTVKELESTLGTSYINSPFFYETTIYKKISDYLYAIGDSHIIKYDYTKKKQPN